LIQKFSKYYEVGQLKSFSFSARTKMSVKKCKF